MEQGHLLELRIPQGRVNRRAVLIIGGLALGCAALAVALAAADLPGVIAATVVAAGLGIAACLGAFAGRGNQPALTGDGIRLKPGPFARDQVLLPWHAVGRIWIARTGRYDYLYVRPREQRHAIPIYLPVDGGVSQPRIRAAVEQFSGGSVRVGEAPD